LERPRTLVGVVTALKPLAPACSPSGSGLRCIEAAIRPRPRTAPKAPRWTKRAAGAGGREHNEFPDAAHSPYDESARAVAPDAFGEWIAPHVGAIRHFAMAIDAVPERFGASRR
jgi:hypothetical protein